MKKFSLFLILLLGFGTTDLLAQKKKGKNEKKEKQEVKADPGKLVSGTFSGLAFRSIGPALTEGRISDIAVDPTNPAIWYLAVSSGGVWKTVNAGTTWKPIFDAQASYSIGCVTIDPNNPLTIWVGTGENNSQRSVGYGDGVYKSNDGGKSWKNVGLADSQHIAKIIVDPRNSDTVFVASQGPLWSAGGDRGVFKTTDGGTTWTAVLEISEHTGVTDMVYDPRNPDIMYAASYQRRRHVWTLINGGPESSIHKTSDGGTTWKKSAVGLPGVDLGRIGLAIAPSLPHTLYAIVEAAQGKSGFYRSTNQGASWHKRGKYVAGSPQYYQEIVVDPKDPNLIYSNDTWLNVSKDGGKTFKRVGERSKHVDNHVTWIDPTRSNHLLVGCDGGLYESFDQGANWMFRANLPITQFYKISTDNAEPVYNVFGGTQDNYSLAGPSRTLNQHGIRNSDWYVTHGGDGFETQVDPKDPNTIYAQAQYGNLARFDKISGEEVNIQPQAEEGEALIWNWDSPLLISPHSNTRLYFAANKLFRSDDRGNSWRAVSGDLSRGLDRNKLKVMGRVWGVDTVSKNRSTSQYGAIVALAESSVTEGLLVVGTDDGLIQISEDGGTNWSKQETFPGIPERAYAVWVACSQHSADVIYAGFNNHKMGDFKPYLLRSGDRGKTWTSIVADLPERGSIYSLVEDHVNANLLFAGTEFGVYFTLDTGKKWLELGGGMPTVAARDMEIQKRENDLVVGTFGRGIYILDDYTPLRHISAESLEKDALLFPVKDALSFIPSTPLGTPGKGFQGDNLYTAKNPPEGAVFTYYLPEALQTRQQKRRKQEKKAIKAGEDTPYPSWDELKQEDRERKPEIVLTIRDDKGAVQRRLTGPHSAGFHRVSWNLRLPTPNPVKLGGGGAFNPFAGFGDGPLVTPGTYQVAIEKRVDGKLEAFGETRSFHVKPVFPKEDDPSIRLAFQKDVAELQRVMRATNKVINQTEDRLKHLEKAILVTADAGEEQMSQVYALLEQLADIENELYGDNTVGSRFEPTTPGLMERIGNIVYGSWGSTDAPTQTARKGYEIASKSFGNLLDRLRKLVQVDLKKLEDELEEAGAPWTPGRFPSWSKQ